MECSLKDAITALRRNKTILLIGAGCSTSGGIPDAKGFIEIIRQKYPDIYSKTQNKSYHECMAALSESQRHQLISDHITKAKVNWSHISIAQLIKNGYVDHVITTSFDPLLVRACTMVGIFPAIYDLATMQNFDMSKIAKPAIIYMYGQNEACIQIDSPAQHKNYLENFSPVFKSVERQDNWLIAGYSGQPDDPIFSLLTQLEYKGNLFWITHGDTSPPYHIDNQLLSKSDRAFAIMGYNSDEFFTELTKGLDCFPPKFIKHPFSDIDNYIGKEPQTPKIIEAPSEITLIRNAHRDFKLGLLDKVIAIKTTHSTSLPPALRTLISWAHTIKANQIAYKIKCSSPHDSRKYLSMAGNEYRQAIELHPQMHIALNNWGIAISRYAKQLDIKEANIFFALAYKKYHDALKAAPDKHAILNNWGSTLSEQAQRATGKTSKRLFQMANSKFQLAINIKNDADEVFYNWGNSLLEQARKTKTNSRSIKLYQHASDKYQQALKIDPNNSDTLCNWALCLALQAQRVSQEETADALYKQANIIYKIALDIDSDKQRSLKRHHILNQWGAILIRQAKTKSLNAKNTLLKMAHEKLETAESLQPGSATYNMACLHAIMNNQQECYASLKKLHENDMLPDITTIQNDDDLLDFSESELFQSLAGARKGLYNAAA